MPYRLNATPSGVQAELTATTREELFRDAINAALDVAYAGHAGTGEYEGRVVPVQAAGNDLAELITELSRDCLQAIQDADGTLHSPKWMSFDENRVTANLPLTIARSHSSSISVKSAAPMAGNPAPLAFLVDFQRAAEHG